MKLDAKNDPAIREFENWVKDELHGTRTEQSSSTQAGEFDKIFGDMMRPDYPCTCDDCGMEGTNESMKDHTCNEPPAPRAGEREHVEWYYIKWYEVDLKAYPQEPKFAIEQSETLLAVVLEEETAAKIIADHNQHATLVEQRERLLTMLKQFVSLGRCYCDTLLYDRGSRKCRQCEARELIATIEQEGEA